MNPPRITVKLRLTKMHYNVSGELCLTFLVVLGVVRPAEACAQTKVSQLDVSVQVNEDVVGLDVAVDETHLVDTLDGQCELRHVEARQGFGEDAHSDEQAHHVSSRDVVHDEVEAVTVLEGVVETHHPLVVCLRQDVTLCFHMRHLHQGESSFGLVCITTCHYQFKQLVKTFMEIQTHSRLLENNILCTI